MGDNWWLGCHQPGLQISSVLGVGISEGGELPLQVIEIAIKHNLQKLRLMEKGETSAPPRFQPISFAVLQFLAVAASFPSVSASHLLSLLSVQSFPPFV